MSIQNIIALSGLSITMLIHAGVTVWWAASITGALKHLHECLHRIDKEIEKQHDERKTMWTRIDQVRDMLDKP